MAAITPAQLFPNMTADANGITIPYADLPGLTQAEATPSSGDGRELARVFTNTVVAQILSLPTANRPTKMAVTKASPSGIGLDSIRQSYTLSFDVSVQPSTMGLLDEA